MTGAAIFMFVLGVGSVYSKKSDKELFMYGVKLIIMELLWNVLTLALPMIIGQLIRMIAGATPNWEETWMRVPVMVEYINVFFIAGMCYFVIALLRKLKFPGYGYIALAILLFVIDPFLYMNGKTTGNGVLDYILTTFTGGRDAVSTHPDLTDLYNYSDYGYVYPGVFRAFANASSVILLAALLYAVRNIIAKCKPVHNLIMQFCRNNTPYYAIHPFYYCCILATAAYVPFSAGACTAMAVLVGVLCYGTILVWHRIKK